MSNSIFVPIDILPQSVRDFREAVGRVFGEFNLSLPDVQLHESRNLPESLENSLITIRGHNIHEHCWVSFVKYPAGLTGTDATDYMGDVTTRGSWLFAAVVVMGIFEFGGSIAFNDAGELDGRPEYDANALRRVINIGLAEGNKYLAR